jgi:natural product precursor
MKIKKFQKKLALNKNTIAHLSYEELLKIKGGRPKPPSSACGTVCGGPWC